MNTNKSNGQMTAQISVSDHKKSGFDLSNNVLGTGKIGRIIPTRALHVMPGDTIKQDSKVAVQFEPLAVPILANMDVKQEHFYVPYNVVWKNWDNFISGGEHMDYDGVVPNVSMKRILEEVSYYLRQAFHFQVNFFDKDGDITITIGNVDEFVINDSLVAQLDNVGNTFQIKDLLKPQYEVLKLIQTHYDSLAGNNPHPFYLENISTATADGLVTFKAFMRSRGILDNKYINELINPIIEYAKTSSIILPTSEGITLLSYMYEFYKPFIGLGSNIDYLNMGRVTFTEFLWTVIYELSEYYNHSEPETLSSCMVDLDFIGKYYSDIPLSILNLRANYNIWYNNYRDILLESEAPKPQDTDNITRMELFTLLVPRQRCWEKDAFTTALDNPGTGNVGVAVGANGNVDNYVTRLQKYYESEGDIQDEVNTDASNVYEVTFGGESYRLPTSFLSGLSPKDTEHSISNNGFSLYQLDAAQRAQKWLQKALYFGNRISDFYYLHFGVRFLDARLRLPELLTSSSELVKLDVVMNNTNITTEANGEIYQSIAGDRAAYASAYDNGNSFERFCEEHGVIMSYLTVMPQVTYAYGCNRDYSRLDQFDFAFSEFATLGMDAVYDTEITSSSLMGLQTSLDIKPRVFGYQGKYYDYKSKHSEEHGELLDTQDMYTFSRKFNMLDPEGRPKLNYEFVHCFPDLDMFVVNSSLSDYFRYDIRHSTAAERELPSQSIYI